VPLDEEDEEALEGERKEAPAPAGVTGRRDADAGDDPAWTDEDSSDEERRRKKGKKDRR
jgi:hypothetical protein